ncbi:hypothetical protein C0J52_18698, partial [Blattella germanica]
KIDTIDNTRYIHYTLVHIGLLSHRHFTISQNISKFFGTLYIVCFLSNCRYNNTNDYSDLAQNVWNSMSKDNRINVLKEMSNSLRKTTSYLQEEITKLVIQSVPELGYGLRKALFGSLKATN